MIQLDKAVSLIKSGSVVAFPTETVYGLGANAYNELACQKIFKLKGRPANNPLIVHVASIEQAKEIVEFNEYADKLSKLWPGPITLVLLAKKSNLLAPCVTANLKTVAIRIPANSVALDLIAHSNCPIAAPSANRSGKLSVTNAAQILTEFNNEIPIIQSLDCCQYGIESSIVDISSTIPSILRLGFISPEEIEHVLGTTLEKASSLSVIKAPGMMFKHYAPTTKLRLNAISLEDREIGLNFSSSMLYREGSMNLSSKGNLIEAAQNLFNYLYILDHYAMLYDINTIAVAPIPKEGVGLAINDRLYRASF